MKRSRLISMLALSVATAAALAACSTSAAPSAGTGASSGAPTATSELTYMVFETPALNAKFWDASIEAALTDLPNVKVKKIVSPDADRNAYAKQLQASGQFPDILASINSKDFLEAGLLRNFDQAWLDTNFLQPNGNSIDGKTYIPPTNSQVIPLVFYNKKLFADNGIEVPSTWAQFKDAVKKLRAAGITPIELAGAEPWAASMPLWPARTSSARIQSGSRSAMRAR